MNDFIFLKEKAVTICANLLDYQSLAQIDGSIVHEELPNTAMLFDMNDKLVENCEVVLISDKIVLTTTVACAQQQIRDLKK